MSVTFIECSNPMKKVKKPLCQPMLVLCTATTSAGCGGLVLVCGWMRGARLGNCRMTSLFGAKSSKLSGGWRQQQQERCKCWMATLQRKLGAPTAVAYFHRLGAQARCHRAADETHLSWR